MDNVKKISKTWLLALIAVTGLVLTSCLDDDDNDNERIPVALVSLYQGSPDAPDLDIEVDNTTVNYYPFEYADYTGYLRFYTGERNLQFGPFGASNIVLDTTLTFEENRIYSVFVVDEYEEISVVVLNDNSDQPASGKSKVRVVNLSPDAAPVNVVVAGEANVIADDIHFKEASDFMEVDSDQYDLQVRNASDDELLLSVPDMNLLPGYYYTIIIRGYVDPPEGNTSVLSAQVVVN